MTIRYLASLLLALCLLALGGCGDNLSDAGQGSILLSNNSISFGATVVGASSTEVLQIRNTGTESLQLKSVDLKTDTGFVAVGEFSPQTLAPSEEATVTLTYAPLDNRPSSGTLTVRSSDPAKGVLPVPVAAPASLPSLRATPDPLDLGTVELGSSTSATLTLTNIGYARASICDIELVGEGTITADVQEVVAAAGMDATHPLILPTVLSDDADNELVFHVNFDASSPGDAVAELIVRHDDTDWGDDACKVLSGSFDDERASWEITRVRITARADDAFLQVEPDPVDFGERPVGALSRRSVTVTNLGGLPVTITGIRTDHSAHPEFDVDETAQPAFPVELAPNDLTTFTVTFQPNDLGVPHAGIATIDYQKSNGEPGTPLTVGLLGVGSPKQCPIAIAKGRIQSDDQGRWATDIDWAHPLERVILDGTESFDPDSDVIGDFRWTVLEKPEDAINGLDPYDGDAVNPAMQQFDLYFAGVYRFRLDVVDGEGIEACEGAEVVVRAFPDKALAVELAWHNPNDPDETDNEGADLDLHFVKMVSPWFDPAYDVYFENKEPVWTPELPSLDIDDTDGGGPETITLDNPDTCQWYAVGAHHFRAAFGTAYATVRIYVNGQVQSEYLNRPLRLTDDFWDVARIYWNGSTATIFDIDEITPGFDPNAQVSPVVSDDMLASGLWNELGTGCPTEP